MYIMRVIKRQGPSSLNSLVKKLQKYSTDISLTKFTGYANEFVSNWNLIGTSASNKFVIPNRPICGFHHITIEVLSNL